MQKIVGHDWQDIQAMQSKTHVSRKVDTTRAGINKVRYTWYA